MKFAGFLLLLAGWVLLLAAVVLFRTAAHPRAIFVAVGAAIEIVGLILAASSHRAQSRERE